MKAACCHRVNLDDADESDDDESDAVKALAAISSTINFASERQSQKQRKRAFNLAHLNAVARDVKSGKISLPDIDVATNDECE